MGGVRHSSLPRRTLLLPVILPQKSLFPPMMQLFQTWCSFSANLLLSQDEHKQEEDMPKLAKLAQLGSFRMKEVCAKAKP